MDVRMKEAIEAYKSKMTGHSGFIIKSCGFIVDKEAPFLGASPDALVECTCCGYGVLEVKCPFSAKEAESLRQVAEQQKDFCLQLLPSKSLKLSTNHPYYLQCQLQIYTTGRSYCDFVVWHPAGLHIERLTLDKNHLRDALHKAELFFSHCVLPELTAKWFTNDSRTPLSAIEPPDVHDEDDGRWCYCKESKGGEMVACDNKDCDVKWYHMSCLSMTEATSKKWLCPTCHQSEKLNKK